MCSWPSLPPSVMLYFTYLIISFVPCLVIFILGFFFGHIQMLSHAEISAFPVQPCSQGYRILSSVTAPASCLALTLLSTQSECCSKSVFCRLTSSYVYLFGFWFTLLMHFINCPCLATLHKLRFFPFAASVDCTILRQKLSA